MFHRRNLTLLAVFLILFFIILARLAQMQIVWGSRYEQDYKAGAGGEELIETIRGGIYSADGTVLAEDAVSYDIAVYYPVLASNNWIEDVAALTGESIEVLRQRSDNICRRVEHIWEVVHENTQMEALRIVEQEQYHPVATDVPRDTAIQIIAMNDHFEGIKIKKRSKREYHNDEGTSHIVGRYGQISRERWEELHENDGTWIHGRSARDIGSRYRMDDRLGVSGIEKYHENMLRGERGFSAQRIEFHPFRVERVSETLPPKPGRDIYLTLRVDFQKAVMDVFSQAAGEPASNFNSGSAVLLDVESGGVLAAGTWPSYSREEFSTSYAEIVERPRNPLFFRPAQAALPTGSIYKLITAIAALEEKKIQRGTTFNCRGGKEIHNRWFQCLGHHGNIGLEEAIEKSCNVYFYELALKLTNAELSRWGHQFGFGSRSGLDWPGEARGSLKVPDSTLSRVNLSIGQGQFLATTIQVAQAMAAIANGGKLISPHFLRYSQDAEGNKYFYSPETNTLPVSSQNLMAVRRGMRRAVRNGTARDAGLAPFRAAGKTGTAGVGGEHPNHAWFAGYAPYEDPKIAFAVVSERTVGQGGGHAAPLMARILRSVWDNLYD